MSLCQTPKLRHKDSDDPLHLVQTRRKGEVFLLLLLQKGYIERSLKHYWFSILPILLWIVSTHDLYVLHNNGNNNDDISIYSWVQNWHRVTFCWLKRERERLKCTMIDLCTYTKPLLTFMEMYDRYMRLVGSEIMFNMNDKYRKGYTTNVPSFSKPKPRVT